MADGKREEWEKLSLVGLKPKPEGQKLGKRDDYRFWNQNIRFQSHGFKTWEPSALCLRTFAF